MQPVRINTALLLRTLGRIEAEPLRYDPRWWHCGTSYCMAGWVAVQDGRSWAGPHPWEERVRRWHGDPVRFAGRLPHAWAADPWGWPVGDFARLALGLTRAQARTLHGPQLALPQLRAAVQALVDLAGAQGERGNIDATSEVA